MKHLKHFETYELDDDIIEPEETIDIHKKYFIFGGENVTRYLIYEVLDQSDKWNMKLICRFIWTTLSHVFTKVNSSEIYIGPNQMNMVLYESDTIEEAKEYILTITDAEKYNL